MSRHRLSPFTLLALLATAASASPVASHVSASCSLTDTAANLPAFARPAPRARPHALLAPIALERDDINRATLRPGGVLLHYVWVETTDVPSFMLLPPEVALGAAARLALHTF